MEIKNLFKKRSNCNKCIFNGDGDMCNKGQTPCNYTTYEDLHPCDKEKMFKYWIFKPIIKFIKSFDIELIFEGIVKEPKGNKQLTDFEEESIAHSFLNFLFKYHWVNQTTNGGYSGDDFNGNVYYKIFPKIYLKFYYSC